MLGTILNFLSGGVLTKLVDAYFRSVERKANSENERERIKGEQQLGRLQARSSTVQVAMAYRAFWVVWLLFTAPLGFWWAKIIVVDKMLGWGATDPLTGQVAVWAAVIIENIFPTGAIVGGAGILTAFATALIQRRK